MLRCPLLLHRRADYKHSGHCQDKYLSHVSLLTECPRSGAQGSWVILELLPLSLLVRLYLIQTQKPPPVIIGPLSYFLACMLFLFYL